MQKSELHQHLRRTAYIAHFWRHAYEKNPIEFLATDYGWIESEGKLTFKWFHGDQLPQSVNEITIEPEKDEESETNDGKTFD